MRASDCWYKSVCTTDCPGDSCIRYSCMEFLMSSSGIPENRQRPQTLFASECDYDAFRRLADIKSDMTQFVRGGKQLYITSRTTGNGKTSWAIKLMLKYFDEIWPGNGFRVRGLFIHVPTFLLKCKDFKNTDADFELLKKQLSSVDLVIWDDIASTDISAYDYSQLLVNIDTRSVNNLANIFTGNIVSRDNLQRALGDKLTSRILSDRTEIIEFKGGDKR